MRVPLRIRFTKLQAGGNDFVCLSNLDGGLDAILASPAWRPFVRGLCRRGLGVGADGVIVAAPHRGRRRADIRARFLEPDGSEAALCGNGAACFVYWATRYGHVAAPEVTVCTEAGLAEGTLLTDDGPGRVRVCIPDPTGLEMGVRLQVDGQPWELDVIDTGVAHAVLRVGDLEAVDMLRWGPAIRHHPRFAPRGVNANFVQLLGAGHIAVRTFEFGVEAETLACGTGSAASAIVTCLRENWPRAYRSWDRPVRVEVRGGETLNVRFSCRGRRINSVCLETRVRLVYEGQLDRDFVRECLQGPP